MKIIEEAVEKILTERRGFEKASGFTTPDKRSIIKSYDHLMDIVDSTLRATPITECLIIRKSGEQISPQQLVLNISIAFNMRYYSSLCGAFKTQRLFPWGDSVDGERDIFILLLWKQNMYSLVSAISLSRQLCEYQSKQLIRGYIESFALIYLSLIDMEFANKYSTSRIPENEYMKLWFKELKPSKVKQRIDAIHKSWKAEDSKSNVEHMLLPFRSIDSSLITSGYVESIYNMTSDYIHFKKDAIFLESLSMNSEELHYGLDQIGGKTKQELLLITSKIYPLLSSLLSSLMCSHIRHIKYNELMGDLSELNSSLYLEFWKD